MTKQPEMPVRFLSVIPQGNLSHLVETIWDWESARQPLRLERILPTASAGLIINLAEDQTRVYDEQYRCTRFSAFTLDGPRTRSNINDTDEPVAVMGVNFRPGGAAMFFHERLDALVNESVDLEAIAGHGALLLREQLAEAGCARRRMALLMRWLEQRAPAAAPSRCIAHALSVLDSDPRVGALTAAARDIGWSPRQLGDRFRQQVGLTPKRYLRLKRFHQVIAMTEGRERIDWARVSLDCGYHDQAHMAHEFREFAGISPTAFSRQRGALNQHIAVP